MAVIEVIKTKYFYHKVILVTVNSVMYSNTEKCKNVIALHVSVCIFTYGFDRGKPEL